MSLGHCLFHIYIAKIWPMQKKKVSDGTYLHGEAEELVSRTLRMRRDSILERLEHRKDSKLDSGTFYLLGVQWRRPQSLWYRVTCLLGHEIHSWSLCPSCTGLPFTKKLESVILQVLIKFQKYGHPSASYRVSKLPAIQTWCNHYSLLPPCPPPPVL